MCAGDSEGPFKAIAVIIRIYKGGISDRVRSLEKQMGALAL